MRDARMIWSLVSCVLVLLVGCDDTDHSATEHSATEHGATEHGATEHGATEHGATEHGEHAEHAGAAPGEHADHAHHEPLPAATPLPGSSLYQLEGAFTDQNGAAFQLASLRGGPALVLMFYGSCTTACPILLNDAARVEAAMPEASRDGLRVVLVTFDPEVDTAERLRAMAAERSMPTPRWTLLRGDADSTRELAMVLGVQYRQVADGEYAHSALLTLLDSEGRVASQVEGLAQPVEALAAEAARLVGARE